MKLYVALSDLSWMRLWSLQVWESRDESIEHSLWSLTQSVWSQNEELFENSVFDHLSVSQFSFDCLSVCVYFLFWSSRALYLISQRLVFLQIFLRYSCNVHNSEDGKDYVRISNKSNRIKGEWNPFILGNNQTGFWPSLILQIRGLEWLTIR